MRTFPQSQGHSSRSIVCATVLTILSPRTGNGALPEQALRTERGRHSGEPHSFLAEQCAERHAAVKGAPKARAKRTLDGGEDRSARILRGGMASSHGRLN